MNEKISRKKKLKKNSTIKKILLPGVFLDRDGTINYDYGYVHKFSKFKFRPYVIKGLKYLIQKNYLIFIITNQAGIAKGKFKISDLNKLHRKIKQYLKKRGIIINGIEYCPYHPKGIVKIYTKKTAYRKPGNLMIKEIYKKWNINIKKSFMLGDRKTDKVAANKSKLYYEYVKPNFLKQVQSINKKINNY